ncbi:MAG: GNAT family N-acetyltransferase [Saprospiraceae bacterium]|nr:GNAT family N-acetyltransferase [Saprospiraceae bacterium]
MLAHLVLTTQRLKLQPFRKQDFTILHQMFTDPFVRKYLWDDDEIAQEESKSILDQNELDLKQDGWALWKILAKPEWEPVGFAGLWPFFEEPQPQLLYGLLPLFCGKGYATDAAKAVVHYAFRHLKFSYIDAAVDEPNIRSIRFNNRLGMLPIKRISKDVNTTLFHRILNTDQ